MQIILVYRNANKFFPEECLLPCVYRPNFVSIYKFTPAFVTLDVCVCPLNFVLKIFSLQILSFNTYHTVFPKVFGYMDLSKYISISTGVYSLKLSCLDQ